MLIAKDLMQKGADNKTYCISINLAVLKFATNTGSLSLSNGSHCDSEDEVAYSEVCQMSNAVPVYDMNWMTASLKASRKLYTFEKAEMLLSKVLFLKAWFPSLCVAAFHAELDTVDREACPQSEQYARLLSVRRGLDSAVHGESHWRKDATDGA
uniref:Voraxin alpha n=1 Tax=Hyalomma anatolicum TaxID=176092 RepID=A0A8X8RFT7_9ACAR|nr:voraxin alpha [Hyalomma anatolicum]